MTQVVSEFEGIEVRYREIIVNEAGFYETNQGETIYIHQRGCGILYSNGETHVLKRKGQILSVPSGIIHSILPKNGFPEIAVQSFSTKTKN